MYVINASVVGLAQTTSDEVPKINMFGVQFFSKGLVLKGVWTPLSAVASLVSGFALLALTMKQERRARGETAEIAQPI